MAKFKRHIPGWAEGFEATEGEYSSVKELIENPLFYKWKEDSGFRRYSFAPASYPPEVPWKGTFMVEIKGGSEWWVLAFVTDGMDLPIWSWDEAKELKDPALTRD